MRTSAVLMLLWIPLAVAEPETPQVPVQPPVKPADRHANLIAATNSIYQVLYSSPTPELKNLTDVIDVGCTAISKLLADSLFHAEYKFVIGTALLSIPRRAQTQSSSALFKSDFIKTEEKWLLESGLQTLTTEKILKSMLPLKEYFYLDPTNFDFNDYTSKLKSELCSGAEKIKAIKSASTRRATVAEWGAKLGGVSVVAIDVSSALYYPEASTYEISSDAVTGSQRHVAHGSIVMGIIISNWGEKAPPSPAHTGTH